MTKYIVVAAVEILVYAFFIFFLSVESAWILVATLVLIAGLVLARRFMPNRTQIVVDAFKSSRAFVLGLGAVLLLLFPIVASVVLRQGTYWMLVLIQTMIYLMVALGLNFQLGSTGMMNLATAAFYGVGAYAAGMLSLRLGLPAILTLPAAGVIAAAFGLILSVPIYKTKGHYLALVTLAFGYMIVLALDNTAFTGGAQGLMNIPEIRIFGYSFIRPLAGMHFYANYFYLATILLAATVAVFYRLQNSWVGLSLTTIRDDEIAAKCSGVNTAVWKLGAFATGNFFMGVAGALYAHMIGFISPPNFQFIESLVIVSIVILGGMDNLLGITLGAVILVLLPEKMRVITEYRVLIYGVLIVAMLIFRPRGLLPFKPREYHRSLLNRLRGGSK